MLPSHCEWVLRICWCHPGPSWRMPLAMLRSPMNSPGVSTCGQSGLSRREKPEQDMARDRVKNVYYTVGIPLDSDTLRALKADSAETGVSIPQLLAVRIADWYRVGREMKQAASASPGPMPERASVMAEEQDGANGHGLLARASAAAMAWGGNEEDLQARELVVRPL